MMQRFIVQLIPPDGFEIKGFPGFSSYSIVLDVLENQDPELVKMRRAGKLQTDFAVRPLKLGEGRVELDVTAFTSEVSLALTRGIVSGYLETKQGRFEVLRVEVEDVSAEELLSSSFPVRKFSVRFHTPTFFRPRGGVRGGVFIPMPIPSRMLIGLHKVWSRFLGPMEDELEREEFHKWLESWAIVVSALKLRTKKIEDGDKFAVGFVGWANFSANDSYYDSSFLRKVDALLRLGEIVNVGGMRSKGFGVISYRRQGEDEVGRKRRLALIEGS